MKHVDSKVSVSIAVVAAVLLTATVAIATVAPGQSRPTGADLPVITIQDPPDPADPVGVAPVPPAVVDPTPSHAQPPVIRTDDEDDDREVITPDVRDSDDDDEDGESSVHTDSLDESDD